ncbi:diaminopimelate decarboxylase family protein [Bifidobacterium jacchi]|uniref:Diaminopimelate decarboxylase n=1 Tax=Bifidobacterium jacchi TaxID=2490545 RepID=A0A5N5RCC2_9BIFI|nr:diaminopimelate decarboxylase [Bifidobacterium jacchi]
MSEYGNETANPTSPAVNATAEPRPSEGALGTGVTPIWPAATAIAPASGELTFHGIPASALLDEFGSPLYVIDTDEVAARARYFVDAAANAFNNATTHVSFAGKAFLSKEIVRLVLAAGMYVDTCTMGEMRIALAAGAPGRRLVLHGNNKSDEEIALAIGQGFAKIVVDSPDEPARIAAIAHRLGKRARVMLRVTSGIHAGGHEYISTAHEDQKFGVPLLPAGADASVLDILADIADATPAATNARVAERGDSGDAAVAGAVSAAGDAAANAVADAAAAADAPSSAAKPTRQLRYDIRYPYDLTGDELSATDRALAAAMEAVANGPALAVLKEIHRHQDVLELVGIHSHIGSNIHDADAFIQAARRMMLLRKTFYATDAYTLPEVDLGGGYSVAYTDGEDSMDVRVELARLADAVTDVNRALGMPAPAISFEPGRWIVAPAGVTLYRVGTIKHVTLSDDGHGHQPTDKFGNPISERVYVSVDGGMSDNIRPALYGADYTVRLANRRGSDESMLVRVVGMHCESGDIIVHEDRLPADLKRGDVLAVPVTGAYGRTMASNYNQALIPAVVGVSHDGAHVMLRRQTIDDLLGLDLG